MYIKISFKTPYMGVTGSLVCFSLSSMVCLYPSDQNQTNPSALHWQDGGGGEAGGAGAELRLTQKDVYAIKAE